jgi:hypothetical protein
MYLKLFTILFYTKKVNYTVNANLLLLVFTCPLVLHGHSVDLGGEHPVFVILAVETGSANFFSSCRRMIF